MDVFWTIQTRQAWQYALSIGELTGSQSLIPREFLKSYTWMMSQMEKRLRIYHGGYPIWVWTERPDLRHTGYLQRGMSAVRLKLDLDPKMVLLSDFNAWHAVLNDWFLSLNELEDKLFSNNAIPITKEQFWERIFDLELLHCSEWWTGAPVLQGVVEKVSVRQVIGVNEFTAR